MLREVIFPPHTPRVSWAEQFTFVDCDTGEPIRLLRADGTPFLDMVATIHPTGPTPLLGCGRPSVRGASPLFYDRPLPFAFGCYEHPIVQATFQNGGVTVLDIGRLIVRFGLDQIGRLPPGRYRFSFTFGDGQDGIEIVRGILPILSY